MQSTIGLKIMMAVSGLFFVFFVLMHMYGNLKILASHAAFDEYAHHLRVLGEPILPYSGGLWIFRILLLVAIVAHVYSAATLWRRANEARGSKYSVKKAAAASLSSKWMRWGGIALLLFILFHLIQFTFRWFHVGDATGASTPAEMVVAAFQAWWVTLIYLLALVALGMHLRHGTYSSLQTLGFTNTLNARRYANLAGIAVAAIVVIGFAIPPLAILFRVIQ